MNRLPDNLAASVTRKRLLVLLDTMLSNLDGVKEGVDARYLHDFRVAVRKTRSILSQVQDVFATEDVESWKQSFAWLGSLTGATRDMDVFLSAYEFCCEELPDSLQADLEGFLEYLLACRTREQEVLLLQLSSPRFSSLLTDWENFLNRDVMPDTLYAGRPAVELARDRIRTMHSRVCEEGRAITDASTNADLHELRKSGKKLRYLVEFYSGLFPERQIRKLLDPLKRLLDSLGEFNDISVQVKYIEDSARCMALEGRISHRLSIAMDALTRELLRRHATLRLECKERFAAFDRVEINRQYERLFYSLQV